jgi:hypothetical protein
MLLIQNQDFFLQEVKAKKKKPPRRLFAQAAPPNSQLSRYFHR